MSADPHTCVIYTIGYEGLSVHDFLELLSDADIDLLIDVRDLPLSRKPGFSKRSLADHLHTRHIEYRHIRDLGAPKQIRHVLRESGDWETYRCSFENLVLDRQEELLADVADLARDHRAALMCFERDPAHCHRSLISERMQQLGLLTEAKHLIRTSAPEPASAGR